MELLIPSMLDLENISRNQIRDESLAWILSPSNSSTEDEKKFRFEMINQVMNYAASGEHEEASRQFLKTYPELLNFKMENGFSTLVNAILSQKPKAVKLLLEFEENAVNATVKRHGVDIQPLVLAASTGSVEAVRALLSRQDVEVNSPPQCLPLFFAIDKGQHGVVELLLKDPRTDVNIRSRPLNQQGAYSALHQVAEKGLEKMAALLLNHPDIDVNIELEHPAVPRITPLYI